MRIRLLFSSPELFAKNVQLRLAEALSLPSTDITFTKYYNDCCAQHNLIDNNKATTSSGSSNHHHSHPSQSGDSHSDPSQKKVLWTTSLSTFILDERENQIIYCLCGGLKNWGHTSVYKMWKQVPSITWMINSKGGKIFFENSTCCCRYFLAQRRPRGCHIFQIRILVKIVCFSANPFTGF